LISVNVNVDSNDNQTAMKSSDRKTSGVRGLVPTPTADRPLTEAQEAFRSLLARLESLRESIDSEEEKLDAALSFYAAEIRSEDFQEDSSPEGTRARPCALLQQSILAPQTGTRGDQRTDSGDPG
jgi:hypothetical protein